jgi:hypothetical protein
MATAKGIFLLPVRDNDGRELRVETADTLAAVYARFGGWTGEGTVTGVFRMADGTPMRDVCEKYMAFFEEEHLTELESIIRDFKPKTMQEAIYLEIQRHVDIRLI